MAFFLDNDDDATKSLVLTTNSDLWTDIRKNVRAWSLAGWNGWEIEKPAWFTEAFKESVPDDMIPKTILTS